MKYISNEGGDIIKRFINKKLIITMSLLILLVPITIYALSTNKNKESLNQNNLALATNESVDENYETKNNSFYVDIKGSVKKPGVYLVNEGEIINDLVIKAGGLTKYAYVKNINLSKKLSEEMMIYIYSTKEISDNKVSINTEQSISNNECVCNQVECSECIEKECSVIVSDYNNTSTNDSNNISTNNESSTNNSTEVIIESNKKISINNATKEELMTLSGIGETKAEAIIEYRNINSGFKSIDELLKVSGIGESIFAKIKENITL